MRAEFRYPRGSNSGIYLRGRYEVQIEDNHGEEPDSHKIGGVYGFLTPCANAGKKAGEWQTLEVTLVGRAVTVILNGERIIDRQPIPGITGGALDSDEGAARAHPSPGRSRPSRVPEGDADTGELISRVQTLECGLDIRTEEIGAGFSNGGWFVLGRLAMLRRRGPHTGRLRRHAGH